MTQKSKGTKQNDVEQIPSEISTDDWLSTPISVRRLVLTLLEAKTEDWSNAPASVRKFVTTLFEAERGQKREPENHLPILITILINIVIIVGLTKYLEDRVAFRCITPHIVSPLSVAIILLIAFHLLWRSVYALTPSSNNENIKIGNFSIPLPVFTTFFNEMQIWKLKTPLLGFLFLVLLITGIFLNSSLDSPFYTPDELSALQGFVIDRFHENTKEGIPVGGTLTLTVNEKVFVQARFLRKTDRTCTWYSSMSSSTSDLGCSIVLDEVSRPGPDTLTVLIQSACGTQDFLGLHVEVLPLINQRGQK